MSEFKQENKPVVPFSNAEILSRDTAKATKEIVPLFNKASNGSFSNFLITHKSTEVDKILGF
jgi:hypothetical protein